MVGKTWCLTTQGRPSVYWTRFLLPCRTSSNAMEVLLKTHIHVGTKSQVSWRSFSLYGHNQIPCVKSKHNQHGIIKYAFSYFVHWFLSSAVFLNICFQQKLIPCPAALDTRTDVTLSWKRNDKATVHCHKTLKCHFISASIIVWSLYSGCRRRQSPGSGRAGVWHRL